MSMMRGCDVVELEPGKWYCFVAVEEYDEDFAEFSTYGPAADADAAYRKMTDVECNPGGCCEYDHADLTPEQKARYERMLRQEPPRRGGNLFGRGW